MATANAKRHHGNVKDLTGMRFGYLTVVGVAKHTGKCRGAKWLCVCECGAMHAIFSRTLLHRGANISCGCQSNRLRTEAMTKHGQCKKGKQRSSEYGIWIGMNARCTNPHSFGYESYGGRGIVVCDEWRRSFTAFLAYVGPRPSLRHSLDRINNDGNYEPGNVRWATWKQQQRNRRSNVFIEYRGKTKILSDWAKIVGISQQVIGWRLRHGWTIEQALSAPRRHLKCPTTLYKG